MHTDVLIIGGGPAGLATAIAARGKGLRVTLLDHRAFPIDKACGEGLLPEAVAALRALGVDLGSVEAHPFVGLRFLAENISAQANFPHGRALGMRRTVLHTMLVDRALESGVVILPQTKISGFERDAVCAGGERIAYRWLVGADGQHSAVRRFARLESRLRRRQRFGFRRHYAVAPWSPFVDVHWARRCQMVVTPTNSGEVCVGMFTGDPGLRIDAALSSSFPEIARRVSGARILSSEAGSMTSLGRARAVRRGNVALVGDASSTVDGIAGQGLSLAFRQALYLADALVAGDLAGYQVAHRRLNRLPTRMTRLLLLMSASSALRRRAMRLFARRPAIFAGLVAAHINPSPDSTLRPAEVLDLGWSLLWGG
jgi:menaquinone-9 beta-reductase